MSAFAHIFGQAAAIDWLTRAYRADRLPHGLIFAGPAGIGKATAARAQMMSETTLPALAAGKLVLSDRFVSSTLAYQLGGDRLSADEIRKVADVAVRGRWPDLTVLLNMPAEASMRRVKPKALSMFEDVPDLVDKDRIERRPMEYHEQVRRNYLAQARAMPDRYAVIDASREPNAVFADVLAALERLA